MSTRSEGIAPAGAVGRVLPVRWITPALLIFLGYFVPALVTSRWSILTHSVPAIWPAVGFGVAGLSLFGLRFWPVVGVAMFVTFQFTDNGHALLPQLVLSLSKGASALVGAEVLRRGARRAHLDLTALRDVWVVLAAGAAAALVSMIAGVCVFVLEGRVVGGSLSALVEGWFLGDTLGVLIFGTLIIAWTRATDETWTRSHWLHLVVLLLLIAAVAWLVYFGPVWTTAFYLYPLLIWAAFNLRAIGATSALAVVSLTAVAGTAMGTGPFSVHPSSTANVLLMQQYIGVCALMTLVVAAVSEERREQALTSTQRAEALAASRLAELHSLYESAPIGLAFFNREHEYLRINDELARINGRPVSEHIGHSVHQVLPAYADRLVEVIDQVFSSGEAVSNIELTAPSPAAPDLVRHWLIGFYPVCNDSDDVEAVGAWVFEVSEIKKAEERETLLAREVDHRAKNLLAVVQSVVQLTNAREADELKAAITGRIQALARAHSLLADARWDGAQFGELVRDELAPYLDEAHERIEIDGPELLLRPAAAQSLAMVLHELATNAAKYGALSTEGGRLDVSWSRDDTDIELHWLETGGPTTAKPRLSGFGSKIMRASIERQLHGSLVQDWRPEGLQCTIRISTREALGARELQPAA